MGSLAKIGIISGRAVPLATLSTPTESPFVWKSFDRLGLRYIAEKLTTHEPLDPPQIEQLLTCGNLNALLKLIEMTGSRGELLLPRPIKFVPVRNQEKSLSALERVITKSDVQLYRDRELEYRFDQPVRFSSGDWELERLQELKKQHPWLRLVAPPISTLTDSCLPSRQGAYRKFAPALRSLLQEMRDVGFDRCPGATTLDEVLILHEAGFPIIFRTVWDSNRTARSLAFELFELNRFAGSRDGLHTWLPSFAHPRSRMGRDRKQDFFLLRLLAVASLTLKNVPHKRVSSKYLSLDGIQLASTFGANDFGLGAVDRTTEKQLSIAPLPLLQRVVRDTLDLSVASAGNELLRGNDARA